MRRLPLILLAAFQAALAQTPAEAPPASSTQTPDYRIVSRRADALLRRENGTRLEIDEVPPTGMRIQRPMNRVYWNTSTTEKRLVSIVVEPLGPEEESTTILTAALLVSVSAVESLEDGIRIATTVKQAQEGDGKSRVVQLSGGVKLYRLKDENQPPRFHIKL